MKTKRYKLIFRKKLNGEIIRLLKNGELIIEDAPRNEDYSAPWWFNSFYKRQLSNKGAIKFIDIIDKLILEKNNPGIKVKSISGFEVVFN